MSYICVAESESHRTILFILISQHFVWVIVARCDPKYYHFLRTGDIIDDMFLVLNDYGPYKLTDYKRFQQLSKLDLALTSYLENLDLYL